MSEDRIFKLQQMNLELTRQLSAVRSELDETRNDTALLVSCIVLAVGGKVTVQRGELLKARGKCLTMNRDFMTDAVVWEVVDEHPEHQ